MVKKKKIKLSQKQKKIVEYAFILSVLTISFFFWNTFIIYPIKLFVVITHEISHGLAAIFSGGELDSILVNKALGGESRTIGGNKFIIASAGYLGSLLFGVLLFISGFSKKSRQFISVSLAVLLVLFAANYFEGNLGKFASVFFALIFIIVPIYFSQTINSYLFKLLGLISMFYVAIDIKEDLLTNIYRPSDAQFIAALTNISATFWSVVWLLISVVVIVFSIRWGLKRDF